MLKRSALLAVPLLTVLLITACAAPSVRPPAVAYSASAEALSGVSFADLLDGNAYALPGLGVSLQMPNPAENIVGLGEDLIGTPYRYGGESRKTGFDCSGFVGYLFREEAGIELPRTTGELIRLDAPKVARNDLEVGDILFFNDRGRGQVSHTGIYIGDNQFIHSSSERGGGVRIDSLSDGYWGGSYMQAKRLLAHANIAKQVSFRR